MSIMYSERVIVSILQNWNLCLYKVSKSWKSLAEDELLWCKICHELGCEEDTLAVERIDWKEIVRQSVSHKKLVLSNWKVNWRCRSLNLKLILVRPYLWYIDFLVDDNKTDYFSFIKGEKRRSKTTAAYAWRDFMLCAFFLQLCCCRVKITPFWGNI